MMNLNTGSNKNLNEVTRELLSLKGISCMTFNKDNSSIKEN